MLHVKVTLRDYCRSGQTSGKIAHIVSNQLDIRKSRPEMPGNHWADIPHIAGNQDFHQVPPLFKK
jgi:hypothetical protein